MVKREGEERKREEGTRFADVLFLARRVVRSCRLDSSSSSRTLRMMLRSPSSVSLGLSETLSS